MTPCRFCPTSTDRCKRCHLYLCGDHLSIDDTCNDCELAYHEDRERLPLRTWAVAATAPPLAVLAATWSDLAATPIRGGFRALTTGSALLDGMIMTVVAAVIFAKGAVGVRTWLHRRAFFRPAPARER